MTSSSQGLPPVPQQQQQQPAPQRTKRMYRYLEDKNQRRPSSTSSSPSSSSSAAAAATTGGLDRCQQATSREKRAKVDKACLYCKRSHMACEEKRPCSRCISRGIEEMCLEDSRSDQQQQQIMSSIRSPGNTAVATTDTATTSSHQNTLAVLDDLNLQSMLATFADGPEQYARMDDVPLDWIELQGHDSLRRDMMQETADYTNAQPHQGPTQSGLSSSGGGGGERRPVMTESLQDHHHHHHHHEETDDQGTRADATTKRQRRRQRPWDDILNASFNAEDSTVRPYQYAYGYARLTRWTRSPISGWSAKAANRVHSLLQDEIRPRLRARWQRLSDLQLVEEEQRFLAIVEYIRTHVCEAIDVPLVVIRRTWEIVCANEAWASLCQINVDCFEAGRLCLYQLLSESLAVETFERYADYVLCNASSPLQSTGHVSFSRRRSTNGEISHVSVPVKVSMEPIMDHNGLPICQIATFTVL